MARIDVDFNNIIGKIKPMNGVGQPPMLGIDCSYFKYLKDANIPFSRLHDVGGYFGGSLFVDVPNIFRDFDADENDPNSYEFRFTDIIIKSLYENGCEPVYRLGVTIEGFWEIRPFRTIPPTDFKKWARICENIIKHYNEGWADGFHYGIEYWEIWNEPEVGLRPNGMWSGTAEEYYDFYETAAKHLKNVFGDSIKIGGYASSGLFGLFADPEKYGIDSEKLTGERYESEQEIYRINFFYNFLEHIKKTNTPLDFFTWHSYATVEQTGIMADFFARELENYGYGDVEIHLNEWNPSFEIEKRGSSYAASLVMAMILMMQDKPVDMLCYYDARIGQSYYGGLFNPLTYKPLCAYYTLYSFGRALQAGSQVKCELSSDELYAVAATGGEDKILMISNPTDHEVEVQTNLSQDMNVFLIDQDNFFVKTDFSSSRFTLKPYQVVHIQNSEK